MPRSGCTTFWGSRMRATLLIIYLFKQSLHLSENQKSFHTAQMYARVCHQTSRKSNKAIAFVFLGLFLVFSFVFIGQDPGFSHSNQSSSGQFSTKYGVIVDMGSSGSRVSVFQWEEGESSKTCSNVPFFIENMRGFLMSPILEKVLGSMVTLDLFVMPLVLLIKERSTYLPV